MRSALHHETKAARGDAGFTLAELLIVLVVLGLVVAIAVPRLAAKPSPADSAAELAALLRIERSRAIERGADALVVFDTGNRQVMRGERVLMRWPDSLSVSIDSRVGGLASGLAGLTFEAGGGSSGLHLVVSTSDLDGSVVDVSWLTGEIRSGRPGP